MSHGPGAAKGKSIFHRAELFSLCTV